MYNPFLNNCNSIIAIVIAMILGGGLVFQTLQEDELSSQSQFSIENNTLTILTKPIPSLPPHAHEVSANEVDSIFSDGHGVLISSDKFEVPFDM